METDKLALCSLGRYRNDETIAELDRLDSRILGWLRRHQPLPVGS